MNTYTIRIEGEGFDHQQVVSTADDLKIIDEVMKKVEKGVAENEKEQE